MSLLTSGPICRRIFGGRNSSFPVVMAINYVPAGFAHGYQTLSDDVEVNYLISVPYVPQSACGIRYDDPTFGITWPLPVTEISEKDVRWPNFSR